MRRTILIFGSLSAAIYILFELSKLSLFSFQGSLGDVFLVLSGLLFIVIGILIHRFLSGKQSKTHLQKKSSLSRQEHKILHLMNDGLSNQEIADNLFISESTVKKHVSNILSKLNARRRTEAVKIGRDLDII